MEERTNDLQEKLDYIGLDLNNIPKILLENIDVVSAMEN